MLASPSPACPFGYEILELDPRQATGQAGADPLTRDSKRLSCRQSTRGSWVYLILREASCLLPQRSHIHWFSPRSDSSAVITSSASCNVGFRGRLSTSKRIRLEEEGNEKWQLRHRVCVQYVPPKWSWTRDRMAGSGERFSSALQRTDARAASRGATVETEREVDPTLPSHIILYVRPGSL